MGEVNKHLPRYSYYVNLFRRAINVRQQISVKSSVSTSCKLKPFAGEAVENRKYKIRKFLKTCISNESAIHRPTPVEASYL